MTDSETNPIDYYARHGRITDPGDSVCCFNGLPDDIPSLVEIVQGLMIHVFWAEQCGIHLSDERRKEVQLRWVPRMLHRLAELDDRPLIAERSLDRKMVGNCRDYTILMTAILRHKGVPARARCGFATYFLPNHFEDHWICEYWKADEQRWVMIDAQLDELQRHALKIPFDLLDVPHDKFATGGRAWQMCRSGQADPDSFGILDMHGLPFILNDLVRDFLALNKIEILPWDTWGLMVDLDQTIPADSLPVLDRIASLTLAGDSAFAEIRALYENDIRLRGSISER